jgi:hypothetical protein
MRKLFAKRPSPAMIVAMVALVAAVGGTAYAATAITYKTLDKDARNKVLPISKAKTTTTCDPTTTDYVDCGSVTLKVSEAFPRRTFIVVDGTFSTDGTSARGECRLVVDDATTPVNNAFAKLGDSTGVHINDFHAGWGLNTVTAPLGGSHKYSVKCNEQEADIKFHDIQISGLAIRG